MKLISGLRLSLAAALAGGAVLMIQPAVTMSAQAAPAPVPSVSDAASAPDESSAAAIAGEYGHSVVISSATTATTQLVAEPDGTQTLTESSDPARAMVDGVWQPLNTALSSGSDGMLSPAVAAVPVEFSGGGSTQLARVQSDAGSWLTEVWPNGPLPTPSVSGPSAVYSDVYPGVDLRLTATPTGMTEVLVVRSAEAAANPALSSVKIGIAGATLAPAPGTGVGGANAGSVAASASDGLVSPSPSWWDSSGDGADATGPGGTGVPMPVPDSVSSTSYTVDVAAVARSSSVTYPVFVDPSFSQAHRTFIDSAYPSQNYLDGASASDGYEHVGHIDGANSDDGKAHTTRSFWSYALSGLTGTDILAAHFNTTEVYSYSCSARQVDLLTAGAIGASSTWNNPPTTLASVTSATVAYGYSSSCPGHAVGFDVTSTIQAAADNGTTAMTFQLRAHDESDIYGWKKFAAAASIVVSLNHLPSTPGSASVTPCGFSCGQQPVFTNDATPVLTARSTDADGDTLTYRFHVYAGHSSPTTLVAAGWSPSATASGTTASWTVTPALADGDYEYMAYATDGTDTSKGWLGPFQFTVDTHAPAAPALSASGVLSQSSSSFTGKVGYDQEKVTITPAAVDHAYGYAYAIYPSAAQVVFPTNLTCNTQVGGYVTVCPANVGAAVTVTVDAPDDKSVFAAITFDAAGNAHSAATTISFYSGGDYPSAQSGHSWATDASAGTSPGTCLAPPIIDTAQYGTQPAVERDIAAISGGACWTADATAPVQNGVGISFAGNGVLQFSGAAATVSASGPALDTTKSFTVAAWLNPTQASSSYVATALTQQGVNQGAFYLQNSGGRWRLCLPDTDSTSWSGDCAASSGTVAANTWVFVAGIWDATDHELLLYTSTSDTIGTPVIASHTSVPASSGALGIGRDTIGSTTRYWQGGILDPVAFQGVADQGQLQQLADLTAPFALTAPVAGQ